MVGYLKPVPYTNVSTYRAHTRRTTPSSEAGVDYYCPIGTPVRAAGSGVVFEASGSIYGATGRYVTVDLDDGRRVRYLHLSKWQTVTGQRVSRGQVIGMSGASGYGSDYFGATGPSAIPANTGGPHVHVTLWAGHYYRFGRYPLEPTLDFELYAGQPSTSGSGSVPFPTGGEPNDPDGEEMRFIKAPNRGHALAAPLAFRVLKNSAEIEAMVAIGMQVHDITDAEFDQTKHVMMNMVSPSETVVLTPEQIALFEEAARRGGRAAISSLEFVVTVNPS